MRDLLLLCRPTQWVKNAFVLAPLFFSGNLLHYDLLEKSLWTTLMFCLGASAVYCLNDLMDRETDILHPIKRNRPLAAGRISIKMAAACAMILTAAAFLPLLLLESETRTNVFSCFLLYLTMNVAYCLWLKHKTLVDTFIVASGFVLRVVAGGMATGISVSHWLVLMTFLLALFLTLAKRRDDVVIRETTGTDMRKSAQHYNLPFLNQSISIVASIGVVCYILYSVSPEVTARIGSNNLYLTSIFVLLAVLRYLQLTIVDVRSGSPTNVLLHDRFIQGCATGWCVSFTLILYF